MTEPKPDYIPFEYVEQSMHDFDKTNFAVYLTTLFGFEKACKALKKYFVGRSRNDNGKACIFWRMDKDQKVRTGKIMAYDPDTGKRRKDINPTWVHNQLKNEFHYHLCFFGEHLLSGSPDATVGIVESEKTAIIASIFMPEMVWLATGGNSGCKWLEYSVYKALANRAVLLSPDFAYFNKITGKTCFKEWTERADYIQDRLDCTITALSVLEKNIPEVQRANGFNIADMLVKECLLGNLGLSDLGYPVFRIIKNKVT